MKPVLKWVGGKKKILPLIEERIKKINIEESSVFHDIFCGGLSVSLLASKYFEKIVSNDINAEIINVYKNIKENHLLLINHLKKIEKNHNKLFYYRIRKNSLSRDKQTRDGSLLRETYKRIIEIRINNNSFRNPERLYTSECLWIK